MAPVGQPGSARNAQGRHRAGGDRRGQGSSRTQPDDGGAEGPGSTQGPGGTQDGRRRRHGHDQSCHGAPCWKAICNGPASARASWRPCPRRNLTRRWHVAFENSASSNRRSPQGRTGGLSKMAGAPGSGTRKAARLRHLFRADRRTEGQEGFHPSRCRGKGRHPEDAAAGPEVRRPERAAGRRATSKKALADLQRDLLADAGKWQQTRAVWCSTAMA